MAARKQSTTSASVSFAQLGKDFAELKEKGLSLNETLKRLIKSAFSNKEAAHSDNASQRWEFVRSYFEAKGVPPSLAEKKASKEGNAEVYRQAMAVWYKATGELWPATAKVAPDEKPTEVKAKDVVVEQQGEIEKLKAQLASLSESASLDAILSEYFPGHEAVLKALSRADDETYEVAFAALEAALKPKAKAVKRRTM